MRRDAFLVPLSALLATSIGCAVVDDAEQAEQAEPDEAALTAGAEVARVTTSDGTSWRFIESEPGVLWLWSIMPETSAADWSHLDLDRMSYVEVHRRLTSEPVPRALLEAQARADAEADDRDPSTTDGGLRDEASDPPKAGATAAISAASFQTKYCRSSDYLYCWPSFYGSPYVQRKAFSVDGYVAAVNNTVKFRLRYKKLAVSGWTTSVSAQALPGQVHHVHGHHWGYQRWRRWEVLDNGGKLVRYSAWGLDD